MLASTVMLKKNDVMIIFDRYYDYSIKSVTRENRNVIQSSKRVKITLTGPAHDKNVVLANKDNKIQLIRIFVESLKTLQLQGRESERKLIVTGLDPIPFEVCRGNVRDRLDLKNLQEEADTIIVAQILLMVNEGYRQIQVICEDTDVFVILLHHYRKQQLSEKVPPVDVLLQYPPSAQTAISILLSGCDTVPQLFGIGKKKVIKLLKGQDNNANGIEQLGNIDPDIPWDNTERGCISFICGLYGNSGNKTLAEMRYSKWVEKSKSNTMTSVKDLEKFPPTVEAARLNIKRAYYQASIWTNLSLDIVPLDVEQFGWVKDSTNKTVDPVFLDSTTLIAPDSLLKVTFCGCCSQNPCSSLRCSCKQANVTCGELCKCKGECCNGSAPQEVHNDDLAVVDEVTTVVTKIMMKMDIH